MSKGYFFAKIDSNEVIFPYDSNIFLKEIFLDMVYERFSRVEIGDVVLDVGANVGCFTVKASRNVGETGLIIAVEPDPCNLSVLHENVRRNSLSNVVIIAKACGDFKGTAKFYKSSTSGFHSLLPPPRYSHNILIEVDTLDNIIQSLHLRRVNFVKIDVEGSELEVLEGAKRILDQKNLKLAVECHRRYDPNGFKFSKILNLLRKKGLKIFLEKTEVGGYIYAKR